MPTGRQIEAFEALVDAAVTYAKSMKLPMLECGDVELSPQELCALLERDTAKMPDHLIKKLQALGCVGIAVGKSSFAVGVRKMRDLMKRHELELTS